MRLDPVIRGNTLRTCTVPSGGRGGYRRLVFGARRPLVLAVVVVAVAGWAPSAQADWSVPATISTPHDQVGELRLTSGPAGDLLAWEDWDLIPGKGIFGAPHAHEAVAPGGQAFGPHRDLPDQASSNAFASGPMVNLGGGHVAQLILARTGTSSPLRPEVARGDVDGSFAPPVAIHGASGRLAGVSLAGDTRGDLVLAWITTDPRHSGHRIVSVSVQPPGGHFGPPQIISRNSNPLEVTSAVGGPGDIVVAFASRHGRLLARVRRHGRHWGPSQSLGPAATVAETDVTPFVSASGRVVVAWYHTQLCEGGCESPGYTRVAVQPAGKSRFRPAQLLQRDTAGLAGAPVGLNLAPIVIADSHAAPMVIFLARHATPPLAALIPGVVKVAYPKGLGFAAPQVISPADQWVADIAAATGPRGAILTWIRDDPPGDYGGTVYAAIAGPVTNRFGTPQEVSPSEHTVIAVPAYSPGGHRWLVAWAGRPQFQSALIPGPTLVRESSGQPLAPPRAQ